MKNFIILSLFILTYSSYANAQTCSTPDCQENPYQSEIYVIPPPLDIKNAAPVEFDNWGIGMGYAFGFDSEKPMGGGGFNIQAMLNRKIGFDFYFRGYGSMDVNSDGVSRERLLFGASVLYFPGEGVRDRGFSPYMRGGFVYKSTHFYIEDDWGTREDIRWETAGNTEFGCGIQWRFSIFFGHLTGSVNMEVVALIPGSEERDDDISTIVDLRLYFLFHF
ncbi:MAG: hypothetical protein JXR95_11330 [Deltaproteobacteria bacterium]|nr:hypothetical protein [Deltaproteobacteria bacterium]